MSWSGLFKFVTGFLLAIALLAGAGAVGVRYLITRLSAPPPRPIFANDKPNSGRAIAQAPPASASPQASPSPAPEPSPAASPSPKPDEPGAYQARVSIPIGLVLRQGPSRESTRLGGLEYNDEVTVLETKGDWMRVRLPNSDIEGWVKSGNTERLN
ncbi:SH3 domain-containing protein [Microcoleus sp. FACHB-1515]|uniref:SH3 domain-containing protein n=1 Tax=Cyanophyceae TaxID=3028117 RepID=UPI001684717D|nr:SH3 domain-containing protein [Microcoleus sp. FACHB-1515]MBD2092620.1 SH3 domain-containing protein [Microcoleus sp. FACHB-1515]